MAFQVLDQIPQKSDWANTSWKVVLRDTSYLFVDSRIRIDADLNVEMTQDGVTFAAPSELLSNGLLIIQGTSQRDTTTATGTSVPAGTPFWLVTSMVLLQDGDDPEGTVSKYVQGLTLVDDPEEAGIMGAQEG